MPTDEELLQLIPLGLRNIRERDDEGEGISILERLRSEAAQRLRDEKNAEHREAQKQAYLAFEGKNPNLTAGVKTALGIANQMFIPQSKGEAAMAVLPIGLLAGKGLKSLLKYIDSVGVERGAHMLRNAYRATEDEVEFIAKEYAKRSKDGSLKGITNPGIKKFVLAASDTLDRIGQNISRAAMSGGGLSRAELLGEMRDLPTEYLRANARMIAKELGQRLVGQNQVANEKYIAKLIRELLK